VFFLSAAVFALLGFLAGTRWGVRQFRASVLTVTSFVVVTLLIVGLVFAARGSAWAEALDALARLPEPVRTP
jgi:membrane protein DedA with SNARE-associated domain